MKTQNNVARMCVLAAFSLMTMSGCAFRAPTGAERNALVSSGAFPKGTPAWIASNQGVRSGVISSGVISGGVLPSSFGAPEQTSKGQTQQQTIIDGKDNRIGSHNDIKLDKRHDNKQQNHTIQSIISDCPKIEKEIVKAITETDPIIRLSLHRNIAAQCQNNATVWFLLGKEHLADGNLLEAKRCLEHVVTRDPQHQEARKLLSELNKQINATVNR